MFVEFLSVLEVAGQTLLKLIPISIALGVVFAVLTQWSACNPGRPWWRKREIVTDVLYWFLIPLGARFVRIGLMVTGAAYLYNIHGAEALIKFYDNGFGPLAEMPLWAQALTFLIVSDFLTYWIHRLYHGAQLWRYHAVHHSSEDLDWISAARFHPINILFGTIIVDVALLLAGISPNVMLYVGHAPPRPRPLCMPISIGRWGRSVTSSPARSSTAGTTPRPTAAALRISPAPSRYWDLMFGTFYMPEASCRTPTVSTTKRSRKSFGGQMLYPFSLPTARSLHFIHQFAVNSTGIEWPPWLGRPCCVRAGECDVGRVRASRLLFGVLACALFAAAPRGRCGLDQPRPGPPAQDSGPRHHHRHRQSADRRRHAARRRHSRRYRQGLWRDQPAGARSRRPGRHEQGGAGRRPGGEDLVVVYAASRAKPTAARRNASRASRSATATAYFGDTLGQIGARSGAAQAAAPAVRRGPPAAR